jgi:ABC-type nickel/cobalt efflux system permease component RcnA
LRAHDIPDARVDRAIQVTLASGKLSIEYEVSLADLTLARDLKSLVGTIRVADQAELYDRYGKATAPLNARGLFVSVDGHELELGSGPFDLSVEEHPRFVFHFETTVPESGHLILQDRNYASSEGTSRLALRSTGGVEVVGYSGKAEIANVAVVPIWLLSDHEERATKQLDVNYSSSASAPAVADGEVAATSLRPRAIDTDSRPSRKLSRLIGSQGGSSWLVLWVVALGLGAAHSIQPGHGKTLVAAFALGSRGGWIAGTLLALLTTLVHMSSVVAIAAALWFTRSTRYSAIDDTLTQIAGFTIASVGIFRLGRLMAGRPQHATLDNESHQSSSDRATLVGLAFAGGIIPCWDAVLLVVLAELSAQLPLGLFLLSGFSAGMAMVLVGVGFTAGRIRKGVEHVKNAAAWSRWLGLAGALALTVIGLYLWTM